MDGTVAFYTRVNCLLKPSFIVLDFGCGRGRYKEDPIGLRRDLRVLKGKVNRVIGLDVDSAAETNPFLDEFHMIDSATWPLKDDCIDLCVCDNVLEHIEQPEQFFSEARRVLRKGGYLCIRTPNAWNYIAVFSTLIPNKYHAAVTERAQDRRKEQDVFPTLYRCNNIPRMRAILSKYNFEHVVYGYEAEPSYLSFSKVAYLFGVIHQKIAPKLLRAAIFAFARLRKKPLESP